MHFHILENAEHPEGRVLPLGSCLQFSETCVTLACAVTHAPRPGRRPRAIFDLSRGKTGFKPLKGEDQYRPLSFAQTGGSLSLLLGGPSGPPEGARTGSPRSLFGPKKRVFSKKTTVLGPSKGPAGAVLARFESPGSLTTREPGFSNGENQSSFDLFDVSD